MNCGLCNEEIENGHCRVVVAVYYSCYEFDRVEMVDFFCCDDHAEKYANQRNLNTPGASYGYSGVDYVVI